MRQPLLKRGPPIGNVRRLWRASAWTLAAAACDALLGARQAGAQGESVGGIVVAEASLAPLGDAQVQVVGTTLGAITDASGRFRIAGVSGTDVELEVRRVGYRPARQSARVGDLNVRIALTVRAVELREVVVTGTAGGTQRRALGNAVSTINAAEVIELAPIANVQQLLNARAPGVVIQPASGAVGSGARIRVRGASSFSLSNEPLIYIDGVRVNNTPATGPANQAFGSSSVSRVNDINPEEIESVQVIRGPAAATLYGTEASNGVIQIITKKGPSGAPRWSFSAKQGVNYLRDPEGRFPLNYQVDSVSRQIISIDIVDREKARGFDIFRNGYHQEYDLSVSGGSERVRYFAGAGYENSEGVEPSNSVERTNGRLNLTVTPSEKINLGLNVGYVTGPTNLSAEAGFGGRVWSTVLADARKAETPRRGYHSGTPEEYDLLYHFEAGVRRFTTSLQMEHRPFGWFVHRVNAGIDRTRERNEIFQPRVDSLQPVFGNDALGYKEIMSRDVDYTTLDYAATANVDVTSGLRASTSVGAQYYNARTDTIFTSGSVFPTPGLTSIAATTGSRVTREDSEEDATVGFYVQEQLGWQDRVFLTGAVRSDDNSAFGQNFDRVYYPKVSLSWVLNEESFWPIPHTDAFKLRAAYGESGKQPRTFASLRTYLPVTGPADVPAVTPQFIGNPDLGPERGKEVEVGFDAGFLDDRLGLEFTYYNKKTVDAILEREIAPSVGFSGFQFFNAGSIRNTGVEILARGRPLAGRALSWDVAFSLATNDNEVLSLGDPSTYFVTAGTFLRHQIGAPVGAWYEKRVVSAERDGTGAVVNVMCDDGSGGSVLCTGPDRAFGTADDAPAVYLGRSVPTVEGALSNTITLWGQLRLYALFDFKRGHHKLDGNLRVRCTFFGGRCRENFFPEEFDPKLIAQVNSNNQLVDFLITDASFTKLREVSVSYTLPARWASLARASRATVSVAGRNLYTWTKYGGLEPEAMFLGGSRGGNHGAWEQTTLPQLSQWLFTLNLGF